MFIFNKVIKNATFNTLNDISNNACVSNEARELSLSNYMNK